MKNAGTSAATIVLDADKLLGFRIKSAAAIGAKSGSKVASGKAA